jgi:hypothetical protein
VEARLIHLYSRLLAWLPSGFRDEFGEEMGQVVAARMGEAGRQGSGTQLWILLDELCALPGLWLFAFRRERKANCSRSGRESVMCASPAIDSVRPPRNWALGLWWAVASAAGWVLAAAVMFVALDLVYALWPATTVDIDDIVVPVAMLLCLPLFQWLLLRRRIPRSGYWYLATAAGLMIGYFGLTGAASPALRGLSVPGSERGLISGMVIGLCLGVAQWAVLRRHMRLPGLWVVVSVLGWTSAGVAAVAIAGESGTIAPALIVMGVIVGVWTGLALAVLWKRPHEQAPALG